MERERGQVLPLYIFGILGMLMLIFFTVNYANVVRWQIRAQNAADSAAQSILALQTQQFNQLNILMYASAVEEFRVRRLLNAMLLAAHQQGGCNDTGSCDTVYTNLRGSYLNSVQRYTNDVITFNRLAANLTFASVHADASAILTDLTTGAACASNSGDDCTFTYRIVDFTPRDGLQDVKMDALSILQPSFNRVTGPAQYNQQLLAPAKIEIGVCATIPAFLGSGFFNFVPHRFFAIGRAAATATMVQQEWMQPGQVLNAVDGNPFQPAEVTAQTSSDPTYNWYNTDFGGNSTQAYSQFNVFQAQITSDEFSERLGWWNSIPIAPYTGPKPAGDLGCEGDAP